MIGILDSGAGGLFALAELRRLSPDADIAFFADVKNAPYGNKTRELLTELVRNGIDRLEAFGCDRILMACCTASTVHGLLPRRQKALSVPIISPTAREAVSISKNKKIGVLSTEATRKSRAFVDEILGYEPSARWCVITHSVTGKASGCWVRQSREKAGYNYGYIAFESARTP